jgi:hypothetical protein
VVIRLTWQPRSEADFSRLWHYETAIAQNFANFAVYSTVGSLAFVEKIVSLIATHDMHRRKDRSSPPAEPMPDRMADIFIHA